MGLEGPRVEREAIGNRGDFRKVREYRIEGKRVSSHQKKRVAPIQEKDKQLIGIGGKTVSIETRTYRQKKAEEGTISTREETIA